MVAAEAGPGGSVGAGGDRPRGRDDIGVGASPTEPLGGVAGIILILPMFPFLVSALHLSLFLPPLSPNFSIYSYPIRSPHVTVVDGCSSSGLVARRAK